ncbi:PREDICTED: LETM1 and EF-hand domain-containing 1 mitochondrial [Prunus dulcis]|uniref:PREDICTED: LETM1 and EF-hand domain-containing 1 mitochondrial n=1 Tax=Prunus dulcis TaxID=3755 RepID=A0A5E4F775_PRUDU|nr:PREDICTED: LETM1 and EF-hand domain-containing 1 mitochondrial [Prunus dulcis]
MASRAMLRKKRIVKDYVTTSFRTIPRFQWLEHYHGSQKSESTSFSSIIVDMHRGNNDDDDDKVSAAKDKFRRLGGVVGCGILSHALELVPSGVYIKSLIFGDLFSPERGLSLILSNGVLTCKTILSLEERSQFKEPNNGNAMGHDLLDGKDGVVGCDRVGFVLLDCC